MTEVRRGILEAFHSGSYTARIAIAGSVTTPLTGVAVSRGIAAAEMVPGRKVAVLQFDPWNPDDMVVCAVWT